MATTIFLVNPQTFPSTSYLLDTYSAAAAYSLRQLKTGVTSVVRVRRSSDNAESDFTATEITDGTLTTWTGANDGYVTTWYDQSGSGNDVTQSTAGNQPQIVSSGSLVTQDGFGSVSFNGNYKLVYSNPNQNTLTNVSLFGVYNRGTSTSSNARPISFVEDPSIGGVQKVTVAPANDATIRFDGAATAAGTALPSTGLYLRSTFKCNSSQSEYVNGSLNLSSSTSVADSSETISIGSGVVGLLDYTYDGNICEAIFFHDDQSSNRTAIESDINTHYSIY